MVQHLPEEDQETAAERQEARKRNWKSEAFKLQHLFSSSPSGAPQLFWGPSQVGATMYLLFIHIIYYQLAWVAVK